MQAVWLPYVAEPETGSAMRLVDFGIAPQDTPHKVYPVKDGIVYLSSPAERERLKLLSDLYDRSCREQGWQPPDHAAFRRLPRSGISGWPLNYWAQRAFSTAGVWHVLEEARKKKGGLPVGKAGVAVDFTLGLPYMAYGLDVAGYITCAVSPHVGAYALGAYPHTRYGRIQAAWEKIPLQKGVFDVVVFSDSVQGIPSESLPRVMQQAADLLTPDGFLMITDLPDAKNLLPLLRSVGLRAEAQKLKGYEEGLRGYMQKFRTGEIDVPPLIVARR